MLSATFIRKTAALGLLAGYGTASLLTLADGSDGWLAIYLGALCGASLVLASLRRRNAGRTGGPDALRVDSPKRRWALLLIGVSSLVLAPLWTSLLVYGAHGYLSGKYSIRTGLKSDLRNLMEAQQIHLDDSGSYTTQTAATGFKSSLHVTSPIVALTPAGWTATVSSTRMHETCAVYIGSTPIAPATRPGEPACTGEAEQASQDFRRAPYVMAAIGLVLGALAVATAFALP